MLRLLESYLNKVIKRFHPEAVCLKENGLSMSEAIRYDCGTYEVRLSDLHGTEIVIAEFTA